MAGLGLADIVEVLTPMYSRYLLILLITVANRVEYGHPEKIDFIGRKEKYKFKDNLYIAEGIRNINRVLTESPVFHQDGNLEFIDNGHGAVLGALRRLNKETDKGLSDLCKSRCT